MSRSRPSRALPQDPRIRRVLAAYCLGALAEFATWLAILLTAYRQGGTATLGAASFAMLLPAAVLVPFLATVGDRIPRGRALSLVYAGCALAAAVTGALILAGAPLWAVVIGGAALTVVVALVRPMHFAALPLLARLPGDLVSANALSSLIDGLTLFAGFAVSGLLTQQVGAWVVLLGGAVLLVIGSLLTRGLGLPVAVVPDGDSGPEIRAALGGLTALRRRTGALILLALIAGTSILEGANESLTVTFNDQVLGRGEATAGLIAGAYGLGIALGGALLAGLAGSRRLAALVVGATVLIGLSEASVAILQALGPVLVALTLVGVGVATVLVSARTLLQRTVDDAVLARVLAIQEGVVLGGLMLGAVVGPLLVLWLGPTRAFVPLGLAVAAFGLFSARSLRALEATGVDHRREVALLRGVPFLAALPPYALERLAQSAAWRTAATGTVVVRQGDPGDSYYMVSRGRLTVEVDGIPRPHLLSAGDGFGEIALLRRVPRTATVTAASDCDLLVVASAPFLAAVTASTASATLAREEGDRMLGAAEGSEERPA